MIEKLKAEIARLEEGKKQSQQIVTAHQQHVAMCEGGLQVLNRLLAEAELPEEDVNEDEAGHDETPNVPVDALAAE